MFSRGALGCLALKVKHGQHFSMCSFTCAAMWGQKNQSHMRSSMYSKPRWPTSSWHPFRVTSLCTAGKTSWKRVSYDSLGLALLYRTPFCSRRWLHSHKSRLNSGGPICSYCHYSSVQCDSLEMTKLRVASTCWAQCQSSMVIQVTCWYSCTGKVQDVQIATVCLYGACEAFEGSFLHNLHCCSCDLEVNTWVVRHAPQPEHPW